MSNILKEYIERIFETFIEYIKGILDDDYIHIYDDVYENIYSGEEVDIINIIKHYLPLYLEEFE